MGPFVFVSNSSPDVEVVVTPGGTRVYVAGKASDVSVTGAELASGFTPMSRSASEKRAAELAMTENSGMDGQKRFGIISKHEGELDSRPDSPTTVSFGYFRTKSGRPPGVG